MGADAAGCGTVHEIVNVVDMSSGSVSERTLYRFAVAIDVRLLDFCNFDGSPSFSLLEFARLRVFAIFLDRRSMMNSGSLKLLSVMLMFESRSTAIEFFRLSSLVGEYASVETSIILGVGPRLKLGWLSAIFLLTILSDCKFIVIIPVV